MSSGRRPVVIDVNVPITANRRGGESFACASECAKALLKVIAEGLLILDQHDAIFGEYRRYLNFHGQPGLGDKFFKWFIDNRGRVDLCKVVDIQPIEHEWRVWNEFPDDARLSDFDRSDQKFIAVASAIKKKCVILQARDHKWLKWNVYLDELGFKIDFYCKEELIEIAAAKRK